MSGGSNVQDEIIRLRLDNGGFVQGISKALDLINKFKSSLTFGKAGQSIDEVGAKANGVNFGPMQNGIEGVSKKFIALSTIGITALTNITNKAINAGSAMVKSFTLGPIAQGFKDYETQIGAIQTVLANTGLEGSKGIAKVNTALDQLNHYADKTIYSFPEMAKNVGTFTAAGVGLDQSVNAIKGVANLAALSGSNSEQASTAMYQLSQAIAANKVGLMDWNSVVNAGMGGQIFKEALFNTGKLKGTLKGVDANTTFDEWTKSGNSFRDSLQDGWITGEVLTDTLSQFTGDLTDAQLKSMGYNKEQIAEIQKMAKTANNAATQIKTYTQLKDTLRESVGSAYAGIFRSLFGDIGTATGLFTNLNVVLSKIFVDPVNNLATLVEGFVKLGGRTALIDGLSNAFKFLKAVLKPVQEAFRILFPPATAQSLFALVTKFDQFSKTLKVSSTTASNLKRTFAGVFAIFSIIGTVISQVAKAFFGLFSGLGDGGGQVLAFTGHIGEMLVAFSRALKQSNIIFNAFTLIGDAVQFLIAVVSRVAGAIGSLFSGVDFTFGGAKAGAGNLTNMSDALTNASYYVEQFTEKFKNLTKNIGPSISKVTQGFDQIGDKIASIFSSDAFGNILSGLNTGLLAGIVVLLKKFFSNGLSVDVGNGFFEKIGDGIEGFTGKMQAMQTELKARAIMEIAIAVGILALSLVAMSFIDKDKLAQSLTVLALGLGIIIKAVGVLSTMLNGGAAAKIVFAGVAIGLLAVAMLILAGAMLIFAHMSWEEIGKGLAAVTGLLAGLAVAMKGFAAGGVSTIAAAISIGIIAVALNILAGAVMLFASMSWGDMLRGLAGVGIALVGIAGAMYLFPPNMIATSAGLVLISIAMIGIYNAVSSFASLSWTEMGKGLAGLAGSLVGIGVAVMLMPPTLPLIAIGLIGVSFALGKIADAVAKFGDMSWGEIARGLTALAGSMLILAVGMYAMTGTLAGAAALLVVSFALSIFVPILQTLAGMSWGDVGKGLLILAASLGAVALISVLLTPAVGAIYSLAGALLVLGAAVLLFGAGIALLGVGLGIIAVSGGAAIGVLIGALGKLGEVLPTVAVALAKGLVTFLTTILEAAPEIVAAIFNLLTQILEAIPTIMPSLITALNSIIETILTVLVENVPKIVQAGLTLLISLLDGIKNNIGNVVEAVANVIVAFLDAIKANLQRIIDSGVQLLFGFLEGVAEAAGKVPGEAVRIVMIFIKSIVDNFPGVNQLGGDTVKKLISGISSMIGNVGTKAKEIGSKIISSITSGVGNLYEKAKGFITNLVTGIGDKAASVASKAGEIGSGIIKGIINGIGDIASAIWNKVKGGINSAIESAKSFLGIGGPSKLWADEIGVSVPMGIAQGVEKKSGLVNKSIDKLQRSAIEKTRDTIRAVADTIQNGSDFKPTISPVLDLTNVKKEAGKIDGLLGVGAIVASRTSSQAGKVNDTQTNIQITIPEGSTHKDLPPTVILNQTNNSPEALNTTEIYRQTRNLMSQAKATTGVARINN